jgi:Transglutaminase-like superfamily
MWEPLQRYSALSPEARKLFRRAVFLGALIGVSLRFRGYSKTRGWLQGKLDRHAIQYLETPEIPARLEMICRMVRAAEHYSFVRITCLEESLVLWYLLQSQGISASIRIGVRKPTGKFEAHAWVEREGVALNQIDEQHRHYRAFDMDGPKAPTERQ